MLFIDIAMAQPLINRKGEKIISLCQEIHGKIRNDNIKLSFKNQLELV